MSESKFIPLSVPNISGNAWKYVKDCLDTGWVSSAGSYVETFERRIASFTGSAHAVAVVNGTSAIQIALKLSGVEPGDEVLVPTLTFIAPVNAVRYLNAEPVFMDCDGFLNLDPDKFAEFLSVSCRKTPKGTLNKKTGRYVRAVLPVHVFGNPCNLDAIMPVAREYGLRVVEDATESLGSYYTAGSYKGKYTGTIGDFGVYSFNGNKIITTGSGGMVVTQDRKMAEKAKYLTTQAKDDAVRYIHNDVGYNFRLTNIQAALGVAQLEQLPAFIASKKQNYSEYKKLISGVRGIELMGIPKGTSPNYWFYSLLINPSLFGVDREGLMNAMSKAGIQSRPIWYLNHLQKPYMSSQSYKIVKAKWFSERVLNLPCSSGLTKNQILKVADLLRSIPSK